MVRYLPSDMAVPTSYHTSSEQSPSQLAVHALEFLRRHSCMSLATHGCDGPWAATVFYVNEGFAFYFLSRGNTRHVRNIEADRRVAATVSDHAASWREVRGIQLEGAARRVDADERRSRVYSTFRDRFAFADSLWWTDAPPQPGAELHIYGIAPQHVYLIDHMLRPARYEIPVDLPSSD